MIVSAGRGGRKALVIGNNAYASLPALRTAVGDARAVGAALERLDFVVTRVENLDCDRFVSALAHFGEAIEEEDEVVVHFSGHGVAISGHNYLVPVDVKATALEKEVTARSIDVARAIDDLLEGRPKFVFAVIDACRNNPFQGTGRERSFGAERGLASMENMTLPGVFLLFSASPKQTALDHLTDDDPNETSVFTRALLDHLEKPDLSLQQIAKATQNDVFALASSVSHPQFPEYTDRVRGEPVLSRPKAAINSAAHVISTPRIRERPPFSSNAPNLSQFFQSVFARDTRLGPLQALRPELGDEQVPLDATQSLAFSPVSNILASGGSDGIIRFWNLNVGRLTHSVPAHEGAIRSIAFSMEGRHLASGGADRAAKVWGSDTRTLRKSFGPHKGLLRSVMFSPDGRTLAAFDLSNQLNLWDLDTGLVRTFEPHAGYILSAAFSADGDLVYSGGEDGTTRMCAIGSGRSTDFGSMRDCTTALVVSPDGKFVCLGAEDGSVRLHKPQTGTRIQTLGDHSKSIRAAAFSADSRLLATASEDGVVNVWTMRKGVSDPLLWSVVLPGSFFFSLAFSSDGRLAASVPGDEIRLYEAENGTLQGRLHVLPEGEWAAIGSGGYSASAGAHRWLRLHHGDTTAFVDEAFRLSWLQNS